MLFFGVLLAGVLVTFLLDRAKVPGLASGAARARWAMAAALVLFGTDHLANPDRYLPMIEDFVPFAHPVVLATGLAEIAGGIGLLVPRLRRLAGLLLAVYFVCVFPANVRNALAGGGIEGLPAAPAYYWLRLLFQPVAIWWALYAGEIVRWPFGGPASRSGPSAR